MVDSGNVPPLALVVDDEDSMRRFVRKVLEPMGFRVVDAADGSRWKAACGDATPNVALVDLYMPNKDGIETVRELRGSWPNLPIIISSGSVLDATDPLLKAATILGASRILEKPFSRAELATALRELGLPVR